MINLLNEIMNRDCRTTVTLPPRKESHLQLENVEINKNCDKSQKKNIKTHSCVKYYSKFPKSK